LQESVSVVLGLKIGEERKVPWIVSGGLGRKTGQHLSQRKNTEWFKEENLGPFKVPIQKALEPL
jgi:hypothetical protein